MLNLIALLSIYLSVVSTNKYVVFGKWFTVILQQF